MKMTRIEAERKAKNALKGLYRGKAPCIYGTDYEDKLEVCFFVHKNHRPWEKLRPIYEKCLKWQEDAAKALKAAGFTHVRIHQLRNTVFENFYCPCITFRFK